MTLACALLAVHGAAIANVDLPRARLLIGEGRYQEAYELLSPRQADAGDDADFHLLLGEAALRTRRADAAKASFERALALQPGSVAAHLGLGRAYLALGDPARAKIEFETVLRLDDLPPDLESQAELYAEAARAYAEGRRLLASGYAMVSAGIYRIGASGGGPRDDPFHGLRVGGRLNYEMDDGYALVGSLDYRLRDYRHAGRRDDSDLRWNGAVKRSVGEGNWTGGVRGRVSDRGGGIHRNDYGAYGTYRLRLDEDNQVEVGAELRRRRYPPGRLRERTRNIAELAGRWTRALFDGSASFTLAGQAGREFDTERPDGDSNFFGLSPSIAFGIAEKLGGFAFFSWQNDRYAIERLGAPGDALAGIGTRNDDLYEVGGGLSWRFSPRWSLNPEFLYVRDRSNVLAANYRSTEVWITLRRDF